MNQITLILMTLLCSALAPGKLPPQDAQQLQQAQAHFQAGAFEQAARILEPLTVRHPGDAPLHRLLGHAQYRLDQPEQARQSLVASLKAQGLLPDTLAVLAAIDRSAGRPAAALAALRLLVLLDPHDLGYQLVHIDTLHRMNQHQAAETAAGSLLEKHPASHALLQLLARVHMAQQRYADALDLLVTAQHLGPEDLDVSRMIAELYVQVGDIPAAVDALDRVAAARPIDARGVQIRQAQLLASVGEYEQARDKLLRAMRYPQTERAGSPGGNGVNGLEGCGEAGRADQLVLLGQVHAALGDPAAAMAAWRAAIEAGARDPRVLMAVAADAIHTQSDRLADDLEHLAALDDAPATDLLVTGYLQLDRPDLAMQAATRYVARHRLDPQAKAWIARIAQRR